MVVLFYFDYFPVGRVKTVLPFTFWPKIPEFLGTCKKKTTTIESNRNRAAFNWQSQLTLQPITNDVDNTVNQWKLELHIADAKRGKTCLSESRLAMILLLIGLKVARVFKPIVWRGWCKTNCFSTLEWKSLWRRWKGRASRPEGRKAEMIYDQVPTA